MGKSDDHLKVSCTIMKLQHFDAEGTFDNMEKMKSDLHAAKAGQKETEKRLNETNAKLANLEAKVNERDKGKKMKKPNCPICLEEMSTDTMIAQCISGHHICWGCKEKLAKNDCPSCGKPVDGRAFGMESYLKYLFQD